MSRFIATLGRGALGLALAGAVLTAAPAAAQSPAQIQAAVDAAYAKYKGNNDGAVADYIPALAKVDPKVFGIAVVTADGKVYTAGDLTTEVSIQSISKVYTMALVMDQQGPDAVLTTIGVVVSGTRGAWLAAVLAALRILPQLRPWRRVGACVLGLAVLGFSRRGCRRVVSDCGEQSIIN